jgi:ubiquinone/menaquinone biosynthesis C-methylase UbiE
MIGDNLPLRILKKIALGLDKEAEEECTRVTREMLEQVKEGFVLEIPSGTGLLTFKEYINHPHITFIAAEYSHGMLEQAKKKIKELNAKNIIPIRADVGNLPFKPESFNAVLCLNGIHSFPDKKKAVSEMSRVLKPSKKLHGTLILKGERWLTDLILEAAYYRLLWFTRPALTRQDFLEIIEGNNLKIKNFRTLQSAGIFEAVKR